MYNIIQLNDKNLSELQVIAKGTSGRKVELEEIHESQSIDTPKEELEQET